jgi:hypothetical protein
MYTCDGTYHLAQQATGWFHHISPGATKTNKRLAAVVRYVPYTRADWAFGQSGIWILLSATNIIKAHTIFYPKIGSGYKNHCKPYSIHTPSSRKNNGLPPFPLHLLNGPTNAKPLERLKTPVANFSIAGYIPTTQSQPCQ